MFAINLLEFGYKKIVNRDNIDEINFVDVEKQIKDNIEHWLYISISGQIFKLKFKNLKELGCFLELLTNGSEKLHKIGIKNVV